MNALPVAVLPSAVIAWLDHLKPLYPEGIPKDLLRAKPELTAVHTSSILFVRENASSTDSDSAQHFAGPEGELLQAVITKGLKLSVADTHVLFGNAARPQELSSEVARVTAEKGAGLVVLLGAALAKAWSEASGSVLEQGSSAQVGQIKFLSTLSLQEVLASEENKKLFWGHLKSELRG